MPIPAPGNVDNASQVTLLAVKAKTDYLDFWRWDAQTNQPAYLAIAGTWANNFDAAQRLGTKLANIATGAINDEISVTFHAFSVTARTLFIRGQTDVSAGISTIYVDGVAQGTLDWYDAGGANNVIQSLAITPARIGQNNMRIRIATKNAAATLYRFLVTEMWMI